MCAPAPLPLRADRSPWLVRLSAVLVPVAPLVMLAAPVPARAADPADLCARVAERAGFSEDHDRLVRAVAIGLAESNCRPHARLTDGPTPGCPDGSVDRGLWQINNCYHAEVSGECAYDAQCNADAAYRISAGGSNWTPWTTYRNGRYRDQMDRARHAVDRLDGD